MRGVRGDIYMREESEPRIERIPPAPKCVNNDEYR